MVIKQSKVREMTGLSSSTVYRLEVKDDFPKRIRLSKRRVGWLEEEVSKWIEDRRESKALTKDTTIKANP